MSLKEKFLKIFTYEEYDKKRDEFKKLDFEDEEVFDHFKGLFPTLDNSDYEKGIITEVYKTYPRKNE